MAEAHAYCARCGASLDTGGNCWICTLPPEIAAPQDPPETRHAMAEAGERAPESDLSPPMSYEDAVRIGRGMQDIESLLRLRKIAGRVTEEMVHAVRHVDVVAEAGPQHMAPTFAALADVLAELRAAAGEEV